MNDLLHVTYFLAFTTILSSGLLIYLSYRYKALEKKKAPKITDSEAFTQFFRDATTKGGGVLDISYVNQDNIYYHRS